MAQTIEIPQGSLVAVSYQTPTENVQLQGEFAGFINLGQATFLCLQVVNLSGVTQLMIPLHLIALLEFKITNLVKA